MLILISVAIVSSVINSRPVTNDTPRRTCPLHAYWPPFPAHFPLPGSSASQTTPVKHVSHYFASGRDYSKQVVILTSCGEPLERRRRSSDIPRESSSARKCGGDAAVRVTVSDWQRTKRTGGRLAWRHDVSNHSWSPHTALDVRGDECVDRNSRLTVTVGHFVLTNGPIWG